MMKKRSIKLAGVGDPVKLNALKFRLAEEEGIGTLEFDGKKKTISIEYDLNRITFKEIEKALHRLGVRLSGSWISRFKRGMYKFTEQNELDNLTAQPSSCCEDPKDSCRT